MNLMRVQRLFPIFIALPLAACPSPPTYLAQPQAIEAQGTFTHAASGMRFPDRVDDFRRVALTRYDKDGMDVSAGYNLTSPSVPIIATVYVYPAPSLVSIGSPADVVASAREHLCQGEFGRRKAEIVRAHTDAKLIKEEDIALARGKQQFRGKKANYAFSVRIGGVPLQVSSQLYVFCFVGEKWVFEYRFTSPREVASPELISSFIDDLPWTIPGIP